MASPFDSRLTSILKNAVTAVLKPLGFKKQGNSYVCQMTDLAWVIDVQKGRWNTKEKAEFTLNFGVFVPGLFEVYGNRSEPQAAGLTRCAFYMRVGVLTDHRDMWWIMRAEDDVTTVDQHTVMEIRDRLERGVIPFLQGFQTRMDVIAYLETWSPRERRGIFPMSESIVLAYLGILYHLLGARKSPDQRSHGRQRVL
jgi:hypothetical protein